MVKRKLALLAVVLGASAFACQLVAGIERVEKVDPADAAVAVDGGPVADAAPPADPCLHVTPPPPPAVDDAPNDRIDDFYLALRTVSLVPPGVPLPGFDLDRACTCDPRPETAFLGRSSCTTTGRPLCDLDGGVDNQMGAFLKDYASFLDIDKAANINGRIDEGQRTAIVVISKYNGRANDKEVGFGIFVSEGIREGASCPGSMPLEGFFTPGWCGKDVWTISSGSVTASGTGFVPKAVGVGYVSNYRFVTTFNGVVGIPFGSYRLALGSPVYQGRFVPLDENRQPLEPTPDLGPDRIKAWRAVDGNLGGRIQISELLAALGTVNTPGTDSGGNPPTLCTQPAFLALKSSLCEQVDVTSTSALDFAEGARCDAVSVGVAVTADTVQVRGFVDADEVSNECYPTADGGGPIDGPAGVDYQCP